jgi:hypothetical protein
MMILAANNVLRHRFQTWEQKRRRIQTCVFESLNCISYICFQRSCIDYVIASTFVALIPYLFFVFLRPYRKEATIKNKKDLIPL